MKAADFERVLATHGLIAPDAAPMPLGAAGRPWYVSLVLGAAGWLASLFAFLFVLLLFEPGTLVGSTLAGIVMLGAGFGLYFIDRDNAFFEQLALALSLAGQLALIYAVGDASESASATAGFAAVLSAAVVLTVPNRFAKTLSTLFACIAWSLAIRLGWWGEDWFDNSRMAVALLPAVFGWLVIWVPVGLVTHRLVRRETVWMTRSTGRVARPALTGLLAALSLGTWTSEPFASLTFWSPPGAVPVNWLVLWPLLGVAAALFAALCAFRLRHHGMLGVAIAGALLHLVQFYFLLGVGLVTKSYVMLGVGVVLLLTARALRLGAAPEPGVEGEAP